VHLLRVQVLTMEESSERPLRDPVPALARLVYDAMQDPMLYGYREALRGTLGIGMSSTVAEIEARIRETVPRG
jgi:hypothetical protein